MLRQFLNLDRTDNTIKQVQINPRGGGEVRKTGIPSPCQLMWLELVTLPIPAGAASVPGSSCSNTESDPRSPTPSSFLTVVNRVLRMLKHLLLPQMTLEMGKICLSQRSEDWDNQIKPYTNSINWSNSFRIFFLFSFWVIFSVVTQNESKWETKKFCWLRGN